MGWDDIYYMLYMQNISKSITPYYSFHLVARVAQLPFWGTGPLTGICSEQAVYLYRLVRAMLVGW